MNAKVPPFTRASHDINFRLSHKPDQHIRTFLIPLGVSALFLIFLARLFQLTVVKGAYYQYIANDNRIREILIPAERGTIYDRKGRVITESHEKQVQNPILRRPIPAYIRSYPGHGALGHLLGYMHGVSPKQLTRDACLEPLNMNDRVGVDGVERLYECHLRGRKGKILVEVDSFGKAIKTLSHVQPRPGKSLKLSIDSDIQQKLYDALENNTLHVSDACDLKDKRIGVVGMKPQTGEILVLYSNPSFDPNDFELGSSRTKKYFSNPDKPLFNRALLGTYPPGSVFKPVVAIGALEEKVITEDETIVDNGFIQAGPIKFHNWYYTKYGKTDGEVDIRKALQRSNDIYFYTVGERLTPEKIKKWAHTFGYGKKTGIELTDASGSIPSDFWKRETVGEKWYTGDTYNLSIGQGYLLTTPLQITQATSAIANNGTLCQPTILKADAPENAPLLPHPAPCKDLEISQATLTAVQEGMHRACQSGGTGWPFFTFAVDGVPISVGCKTGTAEAHKAHTEPYAWFTIYAPYEKPEIALTVLVEDAGEGSNISAPIAKLILSEYFSHSSRPLGSKTATESASQSLKPAVGGD